MGHTPRAPPPVLAHPGAASARAPRALPVPAHFPTGRVFKTAWLASWTSAAPLILGLTPWAMTRQVVYGNSADNAHTSKPSTMPHLNPCEKGQRHGIASCILSAHSTGTPLAYCPRVPHPS